MNRLVIPLVVLMVVSLSPPLAAQPAPAPAPRVAELADHLPADTFLYARIPSLAAAWKGFQTLPLHQAWLDEEVQEFFQASAEGFRNMFTGAGGDVRLLDRVLSLPETFPGEIAFAMLDPDLAGGWAVSMSSPEKPAQAEAFARDVVRPMMAGTALAVSESEPMAGVKVMSYHSPQRTVDVAVQGPRLLVCSGAGVMGRLLGPATGRPGSTDGSLARDPAFLRAMDRVGGSGLSFSLYLNVERAIADALEHSNDEDRRVMKVLGITGMKSVAAGLLMDGGRAREAIWLDRPGGHEGIFGIFSGVPVDLESARLAPDNSFTVLGASLKPGDLYRLAFELSDGAKGGPFEDFRSIDKSLSKDMGIKALSDLADLLGTEICLYAALPRGGGAIPEMGFAIEVLKPDRLQTCLDALARTATGSPPKTLAYQGREVKYVSQQGSGFFPVTPCWCVTDGYLLVSHHPTVLKAIIRRLDGKGESLLADEEFAAARKKLPESSVGAVYVSTERLFRYLYSVALPFISMAGDDLPFDAAALPTADAIARHLSFALSALTLEEGGMLVRTDSDGYGPTSLGLYGALAALFFEPDWMGRKDAAERYPACGGNMKHMHQRIEEYRTANGHLPASLADAYDDERSWARWSVRCYEADNRRREAAGRDGEVPEAPIWDDFTYALDGKEAPESLPADRMLLWDSEPRHNGGRVVLLAGGDVTWLLEDAFQRKLTEQWK